MERQGRVSRARGPGEAPGIPGKAARAGVSERASQAVVSKQRDPILQGSDVTEETAAMAAGTKLSVRDVVTVRLPAAGAYLSVLRTATAGLAARLDFTLDEIEDLRIAVDEACAMLLAQAVPGTDLTCEFELTGDAMRIAVSVLTMDGAVPSRDTFAWTVLSSLAGEVDSQVGADDRVTVTLCKRRGAAAGAS
jgi:serine/threonine-protein kinase RsbW